MAGSTPMEPFSTGSSTYISVAAARDELERAMLNAFERKRDRIPLPEPASIAAARRAVEMRATTASSTPFGSPRGQLGFDSPRKAASTLTSPRGGLADSFMSTASRYSQSPLCPKHCGRCDYCGNIPYEGALPYRPLESTAAWKIPYKIPSPTTSSPRGLQMSWPWPANSPGATARFSATPKSPRAQAKLFHTSWAIPNGPGEWHQTPLCPLPY